MINTLEECVIELERITREIDRLLLEKEHIKRIKRLLERQENRDPSRSNRERARLIPDKQRLVDIVRDNPGIDGRGIFELCGDENTRRITFHLSDLRRQKYLENRGGRGRAARWYAIEEI